MSLRSGIPADPSGLGEEWATGPDAEAGPEEGAGVLGLDGGCKRWWWRRRRQGNEDSVRQGDIVDAVVLSQLWSHFMAIESQIHSSRIDIRRLRASQTAEDSIQLLAFEFQHSFSFTSDHLAYPISICILRTNALLRHSSNFILASHS